MCSEDVSGLPAQPPPPSLEPQSAAFCVVTETGIICCMNEAESRIPSPTPHPLLNVPLLSIHIPKASVLSLTPPEPLSFSELIFSLALAPSPPFPSPFSLQTSFQPGRVGENFPDPPTPLICPPYFLLPLKPKFSKELPPFAAFTSSPPIHCYLLFYSLIFLNS